MLIVNNHYYHNMNNQPEEEVKRTSSYAHSSDMPSPNQVNKKRSIFFFQDK
jgi:hypothetical protein